LYNQATGRTHPLDHRSSSAESLVVACLETRDESLWVEFVRRFQPLIATVVLKTARNYGELTPTLHDDLIQETYLKLCANDCRLLKNFRSRHPGAIFGFLKVVTANVVHDHFKASHAAKRGGHGGPESLEEEQAIQADVKEPPGFNSSRIEQTILVQEIDRCLQRTISPAELSRCRRIFWLYYRCGLSARAIASLPDINLTTKGVESAIFRLSGLVRTTFRKADCAKASLRNDSKIEQKGVSRAGSL
jgi:RNA polymerase sigma-70 factor (ECF subfamily)